ncbi:type VI secretion system baseplate subunit TssE [Marinomonas sp. 15G1-11]|uniref:Type VI secretion system baseplate subunit TssE n=1 Tax=Marinomonas phaeophyticola TaxID=3004091 RepID=A0ABT4JR60_9GAMM|nr:type VI secretion system baseplate subunit TssE [Marinomonas sp. 15G1-11]MCZ2720861.1 type VI secretion system baseplate subunit TssE [Marinomonas sp. 15G1-11]
MIFWKAFLKSDQNKGDEILESIRYQLSTLLNSEAPMIGFSKGFREVDASNMRFGLDSSYSISSQMDKDQFARSIESWVRSFEPRLNDVSVFMEESDPRKNVICFSLMAKVKTENGNHVFLFDSNISLSDQVANLEGQEVV